MSRTEAEKRARKNYTAKCKRITLTFYPTEMDLVEHIEKKEGKHSYIKSLIREDMEKDKG